jgi:hypothetical protein
VSLQSVVARVQQIESELRGPAPAAQPQAISTSVPFASLLAAARTRLPTAQTSQLVAGERIVEIAAREIGQTEIDGSNDSARIAQYRSAVAGYHSEHERWCADFASWVAQQAGVPYGPTGGGFSSVRDLTVWAQQTGRYLSAAATPRPGDLMLFGTSHVGIVSAVEPDGTIATIEGNSGNAVSTHRRRPGEWTGFVRSG